MTTELNETKGSVRLEGKIVGFDPREERTYREGKTKEKNKDYRSVSTSIKTSNNNVVYNVDLFGQVPDKKVKIFSNKNNEKKQLEIDFKDRHELPAGFTVFGFGTVGTGLEKDASGKVKMKNYFNYDGAEAIKNGLDNDSSVWVDAAFNIDKYEANGETKTNVKYTIQRIGLLKDAVDFDAENFKEVNSFEQEFVVVSVDIDKEAKKVYVVGRIISFNKSWKDMTFVVDGNGYEKLAGNVHKKLKFGDIVKVQGKVVNGTVLVEIEEEQEINWGGETPEGQGKKVNKNKISEFQITNVVHHQAKVYKETDFIVEEKESPFKTEFSDDLPFNNDEDEDPFA